MTSLTAKSRPGRPLPPPPLPLTEVGAVVLANDRCEAGFLAAELELAGIYLHARYYDPTLGTFLSPDPLHPSNAGVGTNRYAYAFGNPANFTDRSGLECETTWDAGGSKWVITCPPGETAPSPTAGDRRWNNDFWSFLMDLFPIVGGFENNVFAHLLEKAEIRAANKAAREAEKTESKDGGGDSNNSGGNGTDSGGCKKNCGTSENANGKEQAAGQRDTGAQSSDSYLDFNVSGGAKGIGVTGGLYLDAKHRGCGYVGGGLMTPGIGLSGTSSKSGVTKGWNFALQGQAGLAVQVGWAGGSFYWEGGIGFPPSANLTAFYVGCVD